MKEFFIDERRNNGSEIIRSMYTLSVETKEGNRKTILYY